MRSNDGEVGIAFWFLVASLVALMMGRARAEERQLPHLTPAVASIAPPAPALTEGTSPVEAAAKAFRGQVIFSDVLIAPASAFPSGDAMIGALQRLKRSSVEGTDGFWRLHMVAFPSPVSAAGSYRLRATDTTDGKQGKRIRVFEVNAPAGQPELEITDLVLTDVMGFQAGHRYEIDVVGAGGDEAPAGGAGKEDVYAQGVITLM